MREAIEIRTTEDDALRRLGRGVGKTLGGTVRRIKVDSSDPLLEVICEAERKNPFIVSWSVERRYSQDEWAAAEAFQLTIDSVFEPEGEAVGTVYDESTACPHCGAGRTQKSDLVLDLRRVPRRSDIARTIADEWIVSQRLAAIIVDEGITGVELRRARHCSYLDDEGFRLDSVPAGRELLAQADRAGIEGGSWQFWVWLNEPEQEELFARAEQQHRTRAAARESTRPPQLPVWYQLVVTADPVPVAEESKFGVNPCNGRDADAYRCPLGHVAGLNLLTELHVRKSEWDGSDITCTRELVGRRQGALVPFPLLVVSARVQGLFDRHALRGAHAEVAYLR